MAKCPDEILRLVERFDHQSDRVRSPDYNETQLRIDFLNPMFAALGWDIDNRQGFAEQYREVVHEDRVRVAGQTKAPDYSFRIGGQRKFFLEAKKPAVDIKGDWEPAYQLRRYAWSAKLACSLLTDFEGLAVYDTRIRPRELEKASTARREFITCAQYESRWDFIEGTFSKSAVLRGDFDRYCESRKGRGAQEFDEAFLTEIEEWRKSLAGSLARCNEKLDEPGLNFAVQRIIDRILFLRIAEDRGTETIGQLQALLPGLKVYPRLFKLFRDADARYNSGLFHFHPEKDRDEAPDTLTPTLDVDDKTLKDIIKALYYPASPYEFTVVSADILGSVYERFLGKVINLTPARRIKVEDKPEVRKAGGVYYTPTYIVDYIVKNTVGKLLEQSRDGEGAVLDSPLPTGGGQGEGECLPSTARNEAVPISPRERVRVRAPLAEHDGRPLKILDPACGSGSFLIGAYQYLLDWYLQQYLAGDPAKLAQGKKAVLRPARSGGWALTIAERKRILIDHIHGVDIDSQAVEVTKLNLLLKCLEGETSETLGFQYRLLHERALPDLGRNIQCGNSLIGTDIIGTDAWEEMNEDERRRINPFDYERAFPQVFQSRDRKGAGSSGVFDSVIGNPPWGQKAIEKDGLLHHYIRERFPSAQGIFDLYRPFVELAVQLAKRGGVVGQVLPDIVLLKDYESTRELLLDQTLLRIDWWGMAFRNAVIDTATIVAERLDPPTDHPVHVAVRNGKSCDSHEILQASFRENPRATFNLFLTDEIRVILSQLERLPRLAEFFECHEGVHSGNMRRELFVDRRIDTSCRELLFGRDEITSFYLKWNGQFIRLNSIPERKSRERYANVGNASWHERPKLLVRRTGDYVLSAVDEIGRYCSNNFFVVFERQDHPLDLFGLCALLNSRFMTAFFRAIEPRKGRVFAELKIKHLSRFPVPFVEHRQVCEALNKLGAERSKCAARMVAARMPHQRESLAREADRLDMLIHERVLVCFDLSAEQADSLSS